ncbi:TniQ family protein [uncultured Aliiroseovarius sp.]|uniref:TniQ family protein n=1 Tax=uncultured Aliiroseovarius sp. TaxID=1658783 RepID=UPI002633DBF5|nr:TniQ family protein [uncultured Aliiroseovarius sp.]
MRFDSPQQGESLIGFLRRLASLNAFSYVSEFYSHIEKPYGRPMIEDLPGLAEILCVDVASLSSIAPRTQPCDPAVEWRFQRSQTDPVCPSCIAEDKVWQQHWRHSLVSACAIHQTFLLDQCPRCNIVFSTSAGGFANCECGLPFAAMVASPATDFETWVSGLIARVTQREEVVGGYGPWSNDAPSDLGSFLVFLAGHEQKTRSGKEGKTPLPMTIADTRTFLSRAEPWLRSWPHGFQDKLAQRLSEGDPLASSAPARLGKWYQGLMRFNGDAYSDVHAQLSAGIAENFSGPYAGRHVVDRAWISATKAARLLNVRGERVVAAVASGKIKGRQVHSGHGHKHTMVPRAVIESIRNDRERYLTAKSAMEMLGVGKAQFRVLQDAGLVSRRLPADTPPLVEGPFLSDDFLALVESIRDNQRTICSSAETLRFSDINLRQTTQKSKLIAVLQAIQAGTIQAVSAPSELPLGMFEFSCEDIDACFTNASRPTLLTAGQVSELTGWKAEVVTHWCREGLLKASQENEGRQARYLIAPDALVRFQRTFIPLADLARDQQTSSRALREKLRDARITICGEKAVGATSRGALVRIAELI